jgi:hypothetical protein
MRFETKLDAVNAFVGEFNAIRQDIVRFLYNNDEDDEWMEVTLPSVGDRVYIYGSAESEEGEVISADYDNDSYTIRADSGETVKLSYSDGDFFVCYDDDFPMWGYMWSFGNQLDEDWLEDGDGIKVMSGLGFRIYKSEEYGYFFGIDGAGFDFYEAYWIPLYNARGLKWHKSE